MGNQYSNTQHQNEQGYRSMPTQSPSWPYVQPGSFQAGGSKNNKLTSVLPITSISQQQYMQQIVQKRLRLKQCPYICTIDSYQFVNDQQFKGSFTCSNDKQLIVYYCNYDYKLNEINIKNYNKLYTQNELCRLIKCISYGLAYFKNNGLHHGDVSLQNIVKYGNRYQLLDKVFFNNNINAYEKVLQGQPSFISPKQMLRIRYGFIKESPQLHQADDIFSLGMCVLQLASQVPSSLCYKQMNVRFNQDVLEGAMQRTRAKYSNQFSQMLQSMLEVQEGNRIKLQDIINSSLVHKTYVQGQNSLLNKNNSLNSTSIAINKIKASELTNGSSLNKNTISLHKSASGQQRSSKPYTPVTQTTAKQTNPYARYSPNITNNMDSNNGVRSSQYGYNNIPQQSSNINNYNMNNYSHNNTSAYNSRITNTTPKNTTNNNGAYFNNANVLMNSNIMNNNNMNIGINTNGNIGIKNQPQTPRNNQNNIISSHSNGNINYIDNRYGISSAQRLKTIN